jgi:hypothetical protein
MQSMSQTQVPTLQPAGANRSTVKLRPHLITSSGVSNNAGPEHASKHDCLGTGKTATTTHSLTAVRNCLCRHPHAPHPLLAYKQHNNMTAGCSSWAVYEALHEGANKPTDAGGDQAPPAAVACRCAHPTMYSYTLLAMARSMAHTTTCTCARAINSKPAYTTTGCMTACSQHNMISGLIWQTPRAMVCLETEPVSSSVPLHHGPHILLCESCPHVQGSTAWCTAAAVCASCYTHQAA